MTDLKIRRTAGALGAEVSGVDLSQPLSDDLIAELAARAGPINFGGAAGSAISPIIERR